MLTPFGKEVRKLRIDRGLLLKDLADAIGCSPAWLSAVETGRKAVPHTLAQKIADQLKLGASDAQRLIVAAEISSKKFKLELSDNATMEQRNLAATFARRFNELSDEDIRRIRNILNRGRPD